MAESLQSCLDVTRSVLGRQWTLRATSENIDHLKSESDLPHLQAALLAGRNIDADSVSSFLDPRLKTAMPDPSCLLGMDHAVSEICDAVQAKSRILIFSDYDVDGGTSAAQLIRWGRGVGYEFELYVPDRVLEGYGPNEAAFRGFKSDGVDLVVTLDCGAAATSVLRVAEEIDLPVIVIDHHQMHGTRPPALEIVNPNNPEDTSGLGYLAAAGVTFMLIVALQREARARGWDSQLKTLDLLGLAALGTICDVVPLVDLNRALVRQGLSVLSANQNPGIEALCDVAGTTPPFTTYDAGFVIGPRINAGGRIGQADMGAKLLSTDNIQTAYGYAGELDQLNTDRRALQDRMLREALTIAEQQADSADILIVAMPDWHPGIIGIMAGRLKDRFDRPAIVISLDENGQGKGSGRSVSGVDLGAAITAAREAGVIESGGGHAMAAGLSLQADQVEAFRSFMREILSEDIHAARQSRRTQVDAIIAPSAVTLDTVDIIDTVGPYGAGNPQPVFALANMTIGYAERLKGGHVRFSLREDGGGTVAGICFRAEESGLDALLLDPTPPRVHALIRIKRNEWKGRVKVDAQLLDLAPAL